MHAAFLLVWAMAATATTSLKCYQCTHSSVVTDTSCMGPSVSDQYLLDCASQLNACKTVTTKTTSPVALTTTTRSCGMTTDQTGCTTTSLLGISSTVCTSTCTTDGCNTTNGGGAKKRNVAILAIATVLTGLLTYASV